MPYLNPGDFATIQTALDELVNNRQYSDLHVDDTAMLAKALELMVGAKDAEASPGLRELVNELHGDDECEIDDEGVGTSPTDDGTWVQAWVWVPRGAMMNAGLIPQIDCGQCEGTGTITGGLSGDGEDEECPVCDGDGKIDDEDPE